MTANRGLFVRNSGTTGTTPTEGRLVLASLVAENAPATPRQGLLHQRTTALVTGSATDMSYNVGPCTPVLNRATGEGVYIFTFTGTTNIVTDAAPASGSRYDLVYVKQNDPDKGDATNTAVLGVVKGTAAASPVKPTANLPAGAYVLAEVLVASGAANAAAAGVTITQVWRYTALRGVPVPVRNQAERDEITAHLGQRVARLDRNANGEVAEIWTGSAWEIVGPREMVFVNNGFAWAANSSWDAGTLSLNTGSGASSQFTSPQPTFATAGSLSGTIKFTEPGIYAITWMVGPSGEPGNAGYRIVASGTWPGNPSSNGDTVFGQGMHMANQTFWETFVPAPFIRVPQANLEVRLSGIQINGTNNTALVRVIQLAKL